MNVERHILSIPVYRIKQSTFHKQYDHDLESYFETIWPGGGKNKLPRRNVESAEQSFWERYGMPWQFNQVIAWLKIYILGTQIRGELWEQNTRRFFRRPRHKQFTLVGKAFELPCFSSQTSKEILSDVENELETFIKGYRQGKFVLDTQEFKNIAPFINWKKLVFNK